jgi:alpha-galactosidase
MKRRTFLCSTGVTALGALLPDFASAIQLPDASAEKEAFAWSTPELTFGFEVSGQKLRQKLLMPSRVLPGRTSPMTASGVETAIQCSGENSPDAGMKLGVGQPGTRLVFKGKREEATGKGRRLILSHTDPVLGIDVDSFYDSFNAVPVVRRWTRVTNNGSVPVGIEYLSSAMLHSLADAQNYEHELVIHLAVNSWMAEAQWRSLRPSELGFVENGRTSWSEA